MSKKLSEADDLKSLGSKGTDYRYDGADADLLERFPNPMTKGPGAGKVEIKQPEFTSLCPKTGQPDFATIVLEYTPHKWCVESKSLKLYLGSFRNVGEFHESCVRRIANDLIRLMDPQWLKVRGEFTPRGGIPFWPTVEYHRPGVFIKLDELPEVEEYQPDSPFKQPQELGIEVKGEFVGTGIAFPDEEGKAIFVRVALFDNHDLGDASQIQKRRNTH